MLKAYKYQLLPTEVQKEHLSNIFGACRFVYNLALETRVLAWQSMSQKFISSFDLMKQLTALKQEHRWLYDSPAHSLQHSISNLESAFTNFFKGQSKFPKFKKRSNRQSYYVAESIKIDFSNHKVCIPKLKWVEFCRDRQFNGEIRHATVSKTPTGKYFISILIENGGQQPLKANIKKETAIGIDVGLKHFATLSDGTKIDNPKFLLHSLRRLRIGQRTMQRRYKKAKNINEQSAGFKKQRLIVAKLHERVTNQRKDFLHKLSTNIINNHNTICVESLNIAGMLKNKNLSRSISDVGWGQFISYLQYKSDWYGKNLLKVGMFEPSSKSCSCGIINRELKLSHRQWTCICGLTHDRDILAANNIKTFGLRAQPLLVNAAQ